MQLFLFSLQRNQQTHVRNKHRENMKENDGVVQSKKMGKCKAVVSASNDIRWFISFSSLRISSLCCLAGLLCLHRHLFGPDSTSAAEGLNHKDQPIPPMKFLHKLVRSKSKKGETGYKNVHVFDSKSPMTSHWCHYINILDNVCKNPDTYCFVLFNISLLLFPNVTNTFLEP